MKFFISKKKNKTSLIDQPPKYGSIRSEKKIYMYKERESN
jgi:hypothetical protein